MKLEKRRRSLLVLAIAFGLCCLISGGSARSADFNDDPSDGESMATPPAVPSCEIDVPQAQIIGNVDAFEFTDSTGLTFGYSPLGKSTGVSASASILVSTSAMALTMFAADPISLVNLYSSYVTEDETTTTINATINFGPWSAKPTESLNTPLAQVTLSGLTQGVSGLTKQLDKLPWTGRVLQVADDGGIVVMNAGTLANVQVGDQFVINNVQNFWTGVPCQSQYEGGLPNSKAAATLTIVDVSDTTSFGTLSHIDASQTVLPGAQVSISALAGDAGRVLKKKVKIGAIGAKTITLPGGTTFDFANAINTQIQQVILSSNLVAD